MQKELPSGRPCADTCFRAATCLSPRFDERPASRGEGDRQPGDLWVPIDTDLVIRPDAEDLANAARNAAFATPEARDSATGQTRRTASDTPPSGARCGRKSRAGVSVGTGAASSHIAMPCVTRLRVVRRIGWDASVMARPSQNLRANTATLDERAREIATQEVDRANGIDQKGAGLLAVGLALLAAGVAFASTIGTSDVGQGARILWAVLLMLTLLLILVSLGFAIAAVKPRVFRIALHIEELEQWPTVGYLDVDPTLVEGSLLLGSIDAIKAARSTNRIKADRLNWAFRVFAAAVVAIVILAGAVATRMTETSSHAAGRKRASVHTSVVHTKSVGSGSSKHHDG
jgi:hypothetical protein